MKISVEDFKVIPSEIQYKKKPIKKILTEAQHIDVSKAANEILEWLEKNVEQFIDNQRKVFKLDLIIDAEDGKALTMPEMHKLQSLYRAIPDEPELKISEALKNSYSKKQMTLFEDIRLCRDALDVVTSNIHTCMQSSIEALDKLFRRMAYYYEIKGINKGNFLTEELIGETDIVKFEYESFNVGVRVLSPIVNNSDIDGLEIDEATGKSVRQYTIPEGFALWIEIVFKSQKQQMNSLF